MKRPEDIMCKKGGSCSFKLCDKTKKWVCRRCGHKVAVSFDLEEIIPLLENHTKGGWYITPAMPDSFIDSFEDGRHICGVNNFVDKKEKMTITGEEHKANALLIASAPLLYQEVLRLRKLLDANGIAYFKTKKKIRAKRRKSK